MLNILLWLRQEIVGVPLGSLIFMGIAIIAVWVVMTSKMKSQFDWRDKRRKK